MKRLLNEAMKILTPFGFKKLKARFWKIDDGVLTQIDFQRGAHGSYFFVNVCIHPVGLPSLLDGRLVVTARPLEYECIIRQRLEHVVSNDSTTRFRTGLVSYEDDQAISQIQHALNEVQPWFAKWGSFETILSATDSELNQLINSTPILREKSCAMLRCFCAARVYKLDLAKRYLDECLSAATGGYDFSKVDEYMSSLVKGAENVIPPLGRLKGED